MSKETIPELDGELEALFNLGKQLSENRPSPDTVLLVTAESTYLFKNWGYRGSGSDATDAFPANSGVTFDLIASTRGRRKAQEENNFQAATEATEYATLPELYLIESSLSPEELLAITKKNHFLGICLAVVNEDGVGISQVEYFPAWWQAPDKGFFRQRGIASGVYFCNSIRQAILDLVARPQDYESYDPTDLHTYSDNSLTYEAELGGFVMNIKLTQKIGESASDFIEVLRRIQRFLFSDVESFIRHKGLTSFVDYFGEALQLDKFPELRQSLEDEDIHPFVDFDERFNSHGDWWVTPTALRIQVEKLEIDPSFGTATPGSSKTFELFELHDNWLHTNFEQVTAGAYLNRLIDQGRKYGS